MQPDPALVLGSQLHSIGASHHAFQHSFCNRWVRSFYHVLECIQGLRSVGSQEAVLVHVFDVRTVGGLYDNLNEVMLPKLREQQGFMKQAGLRTTLETPLGIAFYEINKLAREKSSSLIVVGPHGESLLAGTVLGSTAHAVLQNAILPVLLIGIEISSGPTMPCNLPRPVSSHSLSDRFLRHGRKSLRLSRTHCRPDKKFSNPAARPGSDEN